MALIDSEAFFQGRAEAIGISPAVLGALRQRGWDTLSGFAYSSGYSPGLSSDDEFVASVIIPLLGANHAVDPQAPKLRRLFIESHTMSLADLKRKVESSQDEAPSKMPTEERASRVRALRQRLGGMDITGSGEPSGRLVDMILQMFEQGTIKYVPWASCTSREQEVLHQKKTSVPTSSVLSDHAGFVKIRAPQDEMSAEVHSDHMLHLLLQRRALAFELAGVARFEAFNAVHTRMFKEMMKTPLPGYQRVSMDQVERADRHVFVRLAELTASGLHRQADGLLPAEQALATILTEVEFLYLLLPMPRSSGSGQHKSKASKKRARSSSQSGSETRRKPQKGKGKGKNKKGAGQARTVTRDDKGMPICFAYNKAEGCKQPTRDHEGRARCDRGMHVCWIAKCFMGHSGSAHR